MVMLSFVFCFVSNIEAQKLFTRTGHISFSSEAPLETIEASNHKVTCVLDGATGKMEFAVLIKAFQFEKALMQEHFNENYMESDKFPKAKFKGAISNMNEVDLTKDGVYKVTVNGELTIHGISQTVTTIGQLKVENGQLKATANFSVLVADHKIEIPAVVRDNIAKEVEIKVSIDDFEVLNK